MSILAFLKKESTELTKNVKLPSSADRNPFNSHVASAAIWISVCSTHSMSVPASGGLQETQHSEVRTGLGPPTDLGAGKVCVPVYSPALSFLLPYRNLQPYNACPFFPTKDCMSHKEFTVSTWRGKLSQITLRGYGE